ncbi:MAG: DUF2269 domain-containing protein [Deltaproteobacteria bacterium]|nr:DUF2269 domain-containing protein [Deltaproteobacteria bacterium]
MPYLILKYIHVISSTILFGTGVGSAFYMLRANLSKDVPSIYFASRNVVLADWLFTTPAVVIQPLTGFLMMREAGYSMTDAWILWSIFLYAVAGAAWLPVVWIQMRMRAFARAAYESKKPLTRAYWRLALAWVALGCAAFPALVVVFLLMVFKPC